MAIKYGFANSVLRCSYICWLFGNKLLTCVSISYFEIYEIFKQVALVVIRGFLHSTKFVTFELMAMEELLVVSRYTRIRVTQTRIGDTKY